MFEMLLILWKNALELAQLLILLDGKRGHL